MSMTDEHLDELRAEAFRYASHGWRLLPLSLKEKSPIIKWADFVKHPTPPEIVEDWFTNGVSTGYGTTLTFNIGIATGAGSGLVVVDCDSTEVYEAARMELGWDSPVKVRTRRGWHLYFKHPGGRIQNRVGTNVAPRAGAAPAQWPTMQGLDLRGDGGFVVAPPSLIWREGEGYIGRYEWEEQDLANMPVWKPWESTKTISLPPIESFSDINLTGISVEPEDRHSVWEALTEHVITTGKKLGDGDGRNQWLSKFAGDRIKAGLRGEDLRKAAMAFQDEFFRDHLDDDEFDRTIRSIEESDRRNHPERYAEEIFREPKPSEEAKMPAYLRPLYFSDLKQMREFIVEPEPILDPFIVPGEITQVVGFSGHGKSMVLMASCVSMARGEHFGPFHVQRSAKVAYFDFELAAGALDRRLQMFGRMIGPPPDDKFFIVSPSLPSDWPHRTDRIHIDTDAGFARLGEWVKWYRPEVVIIDTVRSAALGLDENSAPAWAKLNTVAKACRDTGAAVVLVHHRNKPGEGGLGREAGSTAQLTDLDTQVIVTAVYDDASLAKAKAGLCNENLDVTDIRGEQMTPFDLLRRGLKADEILRSVFQVSYGKLRNDSYNHTVEYVAFAESDAGNARIVSTLSPRRKVAELAKFGIPSKDIRDKLHVPRHQVDKWLGRV